MRLSLKTIIISLLLVPTFILFYTTYTNYTYFDITQYNKSINITIQFILSTTILSTIIGTISAYYISLYNIPYRNLLQKLYIIPLIFPSYMLAMIYGELSKSFMNLYGLIFVTTLVSIPYVFIIMYSYISSISKTYDDTAKVFNISKTKRFFKIMLPLMLPGILSSSLIVFSDSVSEFGASVFFGVDTLMVVIYNKWFTLYNVNVASVFSSLIVITLFVIFYIKSSVQHKSMVNPIVHKVNELRYVKYGWIISLLLMIPLIFSVLIPFIVLNKWFILSYSHTDYTNLLFSTINTLLFALVIIIISIVVSMLTIYLFKTNKLVITLQYMNYAYPGLILSIILLTTVTSLNWYLSMLLMIFAFSLKYSVLMTTSINGYIIRIDRKMYYSAKSLGKTSGWFVKNIQMPLSKRGIILGSMLVFIDVVRELPIMLTLRPYNFETLSTKIFYYYNSEWLFYTAPYFIIMVICTMPTIFYFMRKINDTN